jgi:hypothetical protein
MCVLKLATTEYLCLDTAVVVVVAAAAAARTVIIIIIQFGTLHGLIQFGTLRKFCLLGPLQVRKRCGSACQCSF